MSLNATPSAQRTHIMLLGRRNAGKSSLMNAITGQQMSVVSPVAGTTTDVVTKAMELLPLGAVVMMDAPGLDDEGGLGEKRVEQALKALRKADMALVVIDAAQGMGSVEDWAVKQLEERKIPYLLVINKCDRADFDREGAVKVSALTGQGVEELKNRLAALMPRQQETPLVYDLLPPGGTAILVTPIDESAPKGRIILPQQQVIRELLDHHMTACVVQPQQVKGILGLLKTPPDLIITDSQAFHQVAQDAPEPLPLTSFSILLARKNGFLQMAIQAAGALDTLKDGDRVLVCESCTHHRQCQDIGTVKLPRMIHARTGAQPAYTVVSGGDFPKDLSPYRLILHCGGCMSNGQELAWRMEQARKQQVPMANYGIAIAHMQGILKRSIAMLTP